MKRVQEKTGKEQIEKNFGIDVYNLPFKKRGPGQKVPCDLGVRSMYRKLTLKYVS